MPKRKGQAPLDRESYLRGQATVEYLILFAVLAVITLLSVSSFYPRVKKASEVLFINATERIAR